jgi:lipid-A-disaccharide synthase
VSGPRLFLIAGEPSGDLLGAALIAGLRALAPGARIEGVGGPAMAERGFVSRFPMEELSVMGIAEVAPRLPRLLRRIRETADAVLAARPDALVGIDSPDFCLRVARRVRAARPEQRVTHYVAPSVWAWRPGRAARMAEVVDHVLALLPFEPPLMEAAGMSCDFVGHPAAAAPRAGPAEIAAFRAELGIAPEARLAALLPGSRRSEVARLAPVFAATWRRLRAGRPDLVAVAPTVGPVAEMVAALLPAEARILDPRGLPPAAAEARKRAAFAAADVALAASGTVSLELAAAGAPMVIGYRVHPLTAPLARRLIRVDTSTLVNLVTGTRAVPEFFQQDCTPERLAPAVARLLDDPAAAAAQRAAGDRAMELLGRGGEPPGLRAARSVLGRLGQAALTGSPPR